MNIGEKYMSETKSIVDRIKNDFTYHNPPKEISLNFVTLREKAKELALLIIKLTPSGREQDIALTRLEETIVHANAGIARQYPSEKLGD